MVTAIGPSDAPVPVIETERLRLRAHRADDYELCQALWSDSEIVRQISARAATAEEVWRRLLQYRGLWSLLGYGYWAIEEKASGQYVGDVGFADFSRDMQPSLRGMLECGWVLAPQARGMGYATEAVLAVCAWADALGLGQRAVCIIAPDNAASIRVATKVGFTSWQQTRYRGSSTLVFRRCSSPGG
jgi:RimJ/RimL family protein N-acetyltransferase